MRHEIRHVIAKQKRPLRNHISFLKTSPVVGVADSSISFSYEIACLSPACLRSVKTNGQSIVCIVSIGQLRLNL
ncbi:hypothetical protein CEXT_434171 [Caerostris extrusa]|uniref:Uncharacterized protein n=1 Tax=Caerostris extrusa TaxID=172846 RepID=A0AAV4YAI9_CAEEX|nr:hypothetical protein CEXT_434171 [Caerostris extrusa]